MRGKHFSPSSLLFLRVYFRWEGSVFEAAPLEGPLISPRTTQKPRTHTGSQTGRLGEAPLRRTFTLAEGNCQAMKNSPFPQPQMLVFEGVLHEGHGGVHNSGFNGQALENTSDSDRVKTVMLQHFAL